MTTEKCAYPRCDDTPHDMYGLCAKHAAQRVEILEHGRRRAIPCEVCGRERADLSSGKCKAHRYMIACTVCGSPCKAESKTRMCADCYKQSRSVHRACTDCGGPVNRGSRSGRCRDCYLASRHVEHRKRSAA